MRRFAVIATALTLLSVVGSASAHAWTWASSTDPIVMAGGGGYGTVSFSGGTRMTLTSTLRDTRVGDGRVYARLTGYRPGSSFQLSSGLRQDGGSSYRRMNDQSRYVPSGTLVGNYDYYVRTCRSVTLDDPCSDDIRER